MLMLLITNPQANTLLFIPGRCGLRPSISVTDGLYHVITYEPISPHSMDCLFLITASDDHLVSLHFLFIQQITFDYPPLKITIGDGQDPSDQSTVLHIVTYDDSLPVTFREYVTSRSSRMWVTQQALASRGQLVSFALRNHLDGYYVLNATVTEIAPNGKRVDVH